MIFKLGRARLLLGEGILGCLFLLFFNKYNHYEKAWYAAECQLLKDISSDPSPSPITAYCKAWGSTKCIKSTFHRVLDKEYMYIQGPGGTPIKYSANECQRSHGAIYQPCSYAAYLLHAAEFSCNVVAAKLVDYIWIYLFLSL